MLILRGVYRRLKSDIYFETFYVFYLYRFSLEMCRSVHLSCSHIRWRTKNPPVYNHLLVYSFIYLLNFHLQLAYSDIHWHTDSTLCGIPKKRLLKTSNVMTVRMLIKNLCKVKLQYFNRKSFFTDELNFICLLGLYRHAVISTLWERYEYCGSSLYVPIEENCGLLSSHLTIVLCRTCLLYTSDAADE